MPVRGDWVSWLLLTAAIGCLAAAVYPNGDEWVDPATGDRVVEHRLGLWFSPVHRTVRREPPQGGFTWRGGVNWLSWSSLLVVAGVGCFEAFRQRRRGPTGNQPAADPRAAPDRAGGQ